MTAFDLPFARCSSLTDTPSAVRALLDSSGPAVLEVMLDPNQHFSPRVSSKRLPDGRMVSAPLEDMYPFLPREEFLSNLLIPALAEG